MSEPTATPSTPTAARASALAAGVEPAGLPGPAAAGPVALSDLAVLVLDRWAEEGDFTPATLEKCGEAVTRFARRLDRQGVRDLAEVGPEHCQGFIDAATKDATAPSLTTRHSRRSAIRMFFRTLRELGYDIGDPSLDVRLPSRTNAAARPLTEVEVTLCRATSRMGEAGGRSLHRAVCWALGETTAVSSEISAVRVGDVDHPDQPRWVRLPGTRRHDPRLGELSDWGSRIVARQLDLLAQRGATPATLLSYRGQQVGGGTHAQSSVCNAVGGVLALSGLGTEPDVRPASVRNWAGRRLYEAGLPIEQVARRMGARSLDTVAVDIGLDWRPTP